MAPGVDGLGVVAHHHEAVVLADQAVDDPRLDVVRVLVLVDQDVTEALAELHPGFFLPQQLEHVVEQVVEVELVALALVLLVHLVDLDHRLLGLRWVV
jgi:hypothetical protein